MTRLLSVDRDWPRLSLWLTFANAQVVRDVPPPVPPPPAAPAVPPDCRIVHVGPSETASRNVEMALLAQPPPVVCPKNVSKDNWLGGHLYNDQFEVVRQGERLTVSRLDLPGEGWGLPLQFMCCPPVHEDPVIAAELAAKAEAAAAKARAEAEAAEAEAARWRTEDHYAVLGVPCDFSMEEMKRTYRSLSLRLHPDRPGGSAEAFARVAGAYECLVEPECRRAFDEGAALADRAPRWLWGR